MLPDRTKKKSQARITYRGLAREGGEGAICESTDIAIYRKSWVEGVDRVKGVGVHPHPQLAGPKIPSWVKAREKVGISWVLYWQLSQFINIVGKDDLAGFGAYAEVGVRLRAAYVSCMGGGPQSNELTRGPPGLVQHFIGRVHIGARALHVLNLIWFGYITRLFQHRYT